MPRRTPRSTYILLDAMDFLEIARGEIAASRHPVFTKLLNHHRLIMNQRLRRHYSGVLHKMGESALRYVDSVEDVAPIENVSSRQCSSVRLDARHRPCHSKDVFLVQTALAARGRGNNVILVSEDFHLTSLDPVFHTDYGIRIVPANHYVAQLC